VYVLLFIVQQQTATTNTEQWTTVHWTTVSSAPAQSDNSGDGVTGTINNDINSITVECYLISWKTNCEKKLSSSYIVKVRPIKQQVRVE